MADPRRLDASLDRVARGLGGPDAGALRTVFAHWPDIVGRHVADHTRPLSLVGGVLTVATDEPGWTTQLTYLQADLLGRLDEALGAGVVTRITVRQRPS